MKEKKAKKEQKNRKTTKKFNFYIYLININDNTPWTSCVDRILRRTFLQNTQDYSSSQTNSNDPASTIWAGLASCLNDGSFGMID